MAKKKKLPHAELDTQTNWPSDLGSLGVLIKTSSWLERASKRSKRCLKIARGRMS